MMDATGIWLGAVFTLVSAAWAYVHHRYEKGEPTGSLSLAFSWMFGAFAAICIGLAFLGPTVRP